MLSLPFSQTLLKKILLALVLDFGPVVVFLISFEVFHVYGAIILLMIATIISTFFTFKTQKRLPYVALYVALLTTTFGYISISHRNLDFIQIRDTLYDYTLALTLITGILFKKSLLKMSFGEVVHLSDRAWKKLTNVWILYFFATGTVNEYVRHTYDFRTWVDYKTYVVFLTIVYGVITFFMLYEKGSDTKHKE